MTLNLPSYDQIECNEPQIPQTMHKGKNFIMQSGFLTEPGYL